MKYFFGKITMYPQFNAKARDIVHLFLNTYFKDQEQLVSPISPLGYKTDISDIKNLFEGDNYIDDYKIMNHSVRKYGENIPPLVNAYMNLSPSMKFFGTSINERFGNVEESGIFIDFDDIYEAKKERHVNNIKRKRIS